MSTPKETPTLYNALTQTMGVTTSLHCPPEPIDNPDPDAMFLDELDSWARHASEHGSAASRAISQVMDKVERLKERILLSQMAKQPITLDEIYKELKTIRG